LPDTHPGIWINVGMGSRGLSFAALCAELVASRMDGGPLPISATLARSLDSLRFAKKMRSNSQEKT
jgi:tRNA 5-methylaminomethyl-2-thiouridine biosynthesis bifunctional protein